MRIEEMDTPFLKLDLDALEENLDRFQAYFDEHKIGFRPHIKTHKNLAIARMQVDRGAIGLTCQKLGETEVLVSGGLITDYLVPYNIIGKQKLERLTSLAKQAPMTVAADSEYTVRGLSQAAEAEDVTIGVLIEKPLPFGEERLPLTVFSLALVVFLFYTHRSNISEFARGSDKK